MGDLLAFGLCPRRLCVFPQRFIYAPMHVLTLSVIVHLLACGDGDTGRDPIVDDAVLMDAIRGQHRDPLAAPPPDLHGYPIVLVHGMAGFRPIAHLFDYFYRVHATMRNQGYDVYTAQTDPFQSVQYRAQQLAVQIDEILRLTGAGQVHMVAHSQGGLDSRYLISSLGYGDRIATLITVASPHRGVQLVDMALQLSPPWVDRLARIINALSNSVLGGRADLVAQLHDLTHAYVTNVFNPANPDDPRVSYFSYSGRTQSNPWVNQRYIDIVNPLLLATYKLVDRVEGENDGIVPVASAMWGTYLGAAPADHWDEIGQLPNSPHLAFEHLHFYSGLAHFLDMGGTPPLY